VTNLNAERCLFLDVGLRALLAGLIEGRECPREIEAERWRQLQHSESGAIAFSDLAAIINEYPEIHLLDALRWPRVRGEA